MSTQDQYGVDELGQLGFREVVVGRTGVDLAAPRLSTRVHPANLTGDDRGFTVTYDRSEEHYLVDVLGNEDDFCTVEGAVSRLASSDELDVIFVDYDLGQIAVVPNLEAPPELDADEPGHINPMCATITALIDAELSTLTNAAVA